MRTRRPLLLALLLLAPPGALAACGGEEPAPGAVAPGVAESPVPSMTSRGPATGVPAPAPAPSPGAAPAPSAASIAWDLPDGWQASPPASPMRMAQATIPGPGGPAELAVFHFGPAGAGGTEANIERWVGQVEATGEVERGTFESDGYRMIWVGVPGTLRATGMGMGPSEPQPGSRLLGAVVEGPGGPWYFKITGPEATVAAAREPFFAMLRTVRAA